MKKGVYILAAFIMMVLLFSFVISISSTGFSANDIEAAPTLEDNSVNVKTQSRLKQQVINQFYSLVDYDLEALDEYAPKDEEMEAYYKIFDENAFQEKFNFFAKNYTTQGMSFGEDAFYDRDLIMRIGSRASVLRSRSNFLNSEQIRLGEDDIEIDTTYVISNLSGKDLYNLHIRFYHPKSEGYYEFSNEACWLTDRTCINTLGWKFLGKFNKFSKQYSFSRLNVKDI